MTEENKLETPEEVQADAVAQDESAAAAASENDTPNLTADDDSIDPEAEALLNDLPRGGRGPVINKGDVSEEDAEAAMLAMLDELPQDDAGARPEDIDFGAATAAKAEFQQLTESSHKDDKQNIDLLLDVNLPVSIELGRTRMTIEDILALGPGSVVELNKLAGEPVDLLVNYKVVARGEVVVIDENFGVRITQLLSPEERLRALGEQ
ncbi:MAG TPA: flagellar motor switch protein FliN [candidate division Zixibacteria bacterium]|nr:flagellar motor switch protein FliN [candidate division Zixibacteria bacterium]